MDVNSGVKAFQCIELVDTSTKNVVFINAETCTHHLLANDATYKSPTVAVVLL